MKPNKNTIKVIKEFSILIDKLIELNKLQTPVPEYKKEHTLFETIKKAVDSEKLFIVNEYGEKIEIKLSHTSGDNIFFKHVPNYKNTVTYTFDRNTKPLPNHNDARNGECTCKKFVDLVQGKMILIEECDYCRFKKREPLYNGETVNTDEIWKDLRRYWAEHIIKTESNEPFNFYAIRSVFGTYTHKEIMSNPELRINAKIVLTETLELLRDR